MGVFNEFVPMTYTVEVRISNNDSAPPDPPAFDEGPEDIYPEPGVEEDGGQEGFEPELDTGESPDSMEEDFEGDEK